MFWSQQQSQYNCELYGVHSAVIQTLPMVTIKLTFLVHRITTAYYLVGPKYQLVSVAAFITIHCGAKR